MKSSKLRSGTKVDITYVDGDGQSISLKSTFEKEPDEASVLVSVPFYQGRPVQIDEFTRLTVTGGQDIVYSIEGYVDGVVKIGIRSFWKICKVSGKSYINQRADIRYKTELPVTVIKSAVTSGDSDTFCAMALDISNGGMALGVEGGFDTGEIIQVCVPACGRVNGLVVRAEVCWRREAEKGQRWRYTTGVRFIFDDVREQERFAAYVVAVVQQQS